MQFIRRYIYGSVYFFTLTFYATWISCLYLKAHDYISAVKINNIVVSFINIIIDPLGEFHLALALFGLVVIPQLVAFLVSCMFKVGRQPILIKTSLAWSILFFAKSLLTFSAFVLSFYTFAFFYLDQNGKHPILPQLYYEMVFTSIEAFFYYIVVIIYYDIIHDSGYWLDKIKLFNIFHADWIKNNSVIRWCLNRSAPAPRGDRSSKDVISNQKRNTNTN